MDDAICNDSKRRHEFVLLFDVTDGNPNGDPDTGNLPRVDPETMQGLVTDVCLKRKVRNYVSATRSDDVRFRIFVENRSYLADHKKRAYEAVGAKSGDNPTKAREWMCSNYYDVRSFGAVLVGRKVEGYNCGQVRGPLQLTFGRSIDSVLPLDLGITRVASENRGDALDAGEEEEARTGTMGRKALIPYGLYKSYGFYNPLLARETGFTNEDLRLFWEALQMMWDFDRSASRGLMACRGLYVFSHANTQGCAPAHVLLDRIEVKKNDAVAVPRAFGDYDVRVSDQSLPSGVILTRFVA
ncbi:MAG TPA: type I-C CRISPR-associated protein Cas7/Csd2 [Terriglobales bacterium]|nr:type I-C CRISPR-associated protein Cas7/Csd2 [Terriglobales bacterium]